MAKKNVRIFAILGAAIGTGLTVMGVRRFIQWYQNRELPQERGRQLPESWRPGMGYQSSQAIPATGTAAPPAAREMTNAERVNSDRVGDFDERGTAFTTSEMTYTEGDRLRGEASEAAGDLSSVNVHGDDAATRDVEDINAAGAAGVYGAGRRSPGLGDAGVRDTSARAAGMEDVSPASDMGVSATDTGETTPGLTAQTGTFGTTTGGQTGQQPGMGGQMGMGQPSSMDQTVPTRKTDLVMDEVVAPLIEHAIAFHSVMNLLRSRQREGMGNEGTESLTEGDRNSMRAVLDQMQEHSAKYDEAALRRSPLALRAHQMTARLRDALDNLTYSGADLFRIYDEVRPELCSLARELDNSGQVTITGMDHIRQLYEC